MTLVPPDPSRFWRNRGALEKARERALAIARRIMKERRSTDGVARQVFHGAHEGSHHLDFFRGEAPPLLERLPEDFSALEAGAGMGWLAALMASRGGRVLATEIIWGAETPFDPGNASTFRRLIGKEPRLADVVDLAPDDKSIRFSTRIQFVKAQAERLPARDGSLDLVYSQNCLEHIPGLGAYFEEAARVLRIGGIFFNTTEPLYFSAFGHHLEDIFPVPWGHLLWPAEELAELAVREAGERDWAPGVPLEPKHLLGLLRKGMNFARPGEIRRHLLRGPWSIDGWLDLEFNEHRRWAREIGLADALRGVSEDDLFLVGLRFRLRREIAARGIRLPLRLAHSTRRRLRGLAGR